MSQPKKNTGMENNTRPVAMAIPNLSACALDCERSRSGKPARASGNQRSKIYVFGLILLAVLAFSFFLSTTIRAEEEDLRLIMDPNTCVLSGGDWDSDSGCQPLPISMEGSDKATARSVASTGGTGTVVKSGSPSDEKCDKFWQTLSSPVECGMIPAMADWWLSLVGLLLWLAGQFLDYAATFTLNLSSYAKDLNIDATWATIRDLMNIVFVFALLWISIQTILGLADTKKLLTSIILAALLINFSLFFTKVIIDISNVVALQFYSGITNGQFPGSSPSSSTDTLSGQFMSRLKLTTNYAAGASSGTVGMEKPLTLAGVGTTVIMGSIFIIIAAFVFFAAGLMLAARSAVLIILMVTSPIGFIGGFIPRLATYTKKWQSELANQALFAPIFFMMIWIILKITQGVTSGSETKSFAAVIAGNGDSISIVFNYVILLAFIVAALNVAKELSGKAGASFSKYGATAMGAIAGGAGGWALRGTAGKAMNWAANTKVMKDIGAKDTLGIGNALHKFTIAGAKASDDVRAGVPVVGGMAGKVLGAVGADVEFGKAGGKGGYRGTVASEAKQRKEYGKELDEKYDFTAARARGLTDEEVVKENKGLADRNKRRQQTYREEGLPGATVPEKLFSLMMRKRKVPGISMSGAADIEAANQLQKETFDKGKKTRDKAAVKAQENKLKSLKGQFDMVKDNFRERERLNKEIEEAEKELENLKESVKSEESKEIAKAAAEEAVKESGGKKEEEPKEEKK